MQKEVRLWRVGAGDQLGELKRTPVPLESRLEAWLEQDISILSDELLVIGRQVSTDHGGVIDLLCLDRNADVVVVELKRDKTPRQITAQVLDYASWVRELSNEDVTRIADDYLPRHNAVDLPSAFRHRFGLELPEVVNESHSLLIVASSIDAASHRIIEYLSDAHGVRINAVTFHFFEDPDGVQLLARVFLLQPESVEQRSSQRSASKRQPAPTFEEYQELAANKGVADLYDRALNKLQNHLSSEALVQMVSFFTQMDGGTRAICGLYPAQSSADAGLRFTVYASRLARLLGIAEEGLRAALPTSVEPWKYTSSADEDYSGYAGFFATIDELDRFLTLFQGT